VLWAREGGHPKAPLPLEFAGGCFTLQVINAVTLLGTGTYAIAAYRAARRVGVEVCDELTRRVGTACRCFRLFCAGVALLAKIEEAIIAE